MPFPSYLRLMCFGLATVLGTPVAAQGLLGEGCFVRVYSADHLARHPVQQVTRIALRRSHGWDGLQVDLAVNLRAWGETLRGSALCRTTPGGAMDCAMDGDAGAFRLEQGRAGALRLVVALRGVTLEGQSDFAVLDGVGGDDRVFLIPAASPELCR